MAQLLGEATGARTARVWLRIGNELRAESSWPADAPNVPAVSVRGDELPGFGDDEAFEVRHQGELLGALSVAMTAADPMNATKAKLARDMAAQAGLVLRNVRLIEDLRESRRRIVSAQDERARSLERNIHDGAQQQLVALSVKLRLAEGLVERDPEKARTILADLQVQATETLGDLRDLARGIYPPLLADKGLPAALEAHARKTSLPITVHPDGIGRYGQDVESAVYFCCLEAMNNIAKYADATPAEIRPRTGDRDLLTFEVVDDGRGFEPALAGRGTGLQGMADRLAAIDGRASTMTARPARHDRRRAASRSRRVKRYVVTQPSGSAWAVVCVVSPVVFAVLYGIPSGSLGPEPQRQRCARLRIRPSGAIVSCNATRRSAFDPSSRAAGRTDGACSFAWVALTAAVCGASGGLRPPRRGARASHMSSSKRPDLALGNGRRSKS